MIEPSTSEVAGEKSVHQAVGTESDNTANEASAGSTEGLQILLENETSSDPTTNNVPGTSSFTLILFLYNLCNSRGIKP